MKSISLKKFRKSGERMTKSQYEKESGLEVHSPEIYSYLGFLHIEIHQMKREVGEPMKELYVVHTSDSFETGCLKEAEKNLYENMKSELPKKEKKEKVDPKMPLGLDSYLYTYHWVLEYMYEHKGEVFELLDGLEDRQEFAINSTKEFETLHKDTEWDGETKVYSNELDKFIMAKLFPKKTFTVRATISTECTIEIVAKNEVEACEIANTSYVGDFEEDATTTRVVVH